MHLSHEAENDRRDFKDLGMSVKRSAVRDSGRTRLSGLTGEPNTDEMSVVLTAMVHADRTRCGFVSDSASDVRYFGCLVTSGVRMWQWVARSTGERALRGKARVVAHLGDHRRTCCRSRAQCAKLLHIGW